MTNAARALAALHALRPASLGLGPEPVVTLGEELDRWCKPLETVDQSLVVGWQEVASTLRAAEPGAVASAIVHGDFRLGNLLAVGTEVTAIIDWEIWAIGDPRVDLGWFLANADPKTYRRRTRYVDALPTRDELVAAYTATLGSDVPDLAWFQALACFKSTATWALIVKHNRRRAEPDESVEAMVSVLPQLLERARGLTS
jgi:aminoglycoside phosphotransferase (APT) family kinase protein